MSGITIALLVDRKMERRLRDASPQAYFVTFENWVELAFYDLEAAPLAFIVDPLLVQFEHRLELFRYLGRRRGIPVILSVGMNPETARFLLIVGRMGIRHVMIRGVDDRPERIRPLLAAAAAGQLQGPPPARL